MCKLLSRNEDDPENQHSRLCSAVSRSSDFINKVRYPFAASTHSCFFRKVSFQTQNAKKEEAGVAYYELMTLCNLSWIDRRESDRFLYISRAYKSNAIFVYRDAPSPGKIYLHNLSINIDIVDELNSFDFVEY